MAKNNSGSLDTNVLLRLIVNDIPDQTELIKQLFNDGKRFQVADIVMFEMVFVLERIYGFTREDIVESILTIIRHPKINCNQILFEKTVEHYINHTKLSFVDCALREYSKLNSATPLHTFDKDLVKLTDDVTLVSPIS